MAARHEWWCVGVILIGGAPLLAALVVMLRRGATLTPTMTGALAAIAVGALANVAACFWRPHPNDDVTFVWHGGAILALVLLCVCGAGFVLKTVSRASAWTAHESSEFLLTDSSCYETNVS